MATLRNASRSRLPRARRNARGSARVRDTPAAHRPRGRQAARDRRLCAQLLTRLRPRRWPGLVTVTVTGVQITPVDLQLLYADRIAAGCSPTTVRHLHRFLHRVLDQALRWGLASRNPAALVDPPRVSRHQFTTLSPGQARTLLAALRGDRLQALYVLALTTGMRQGELLALRWADVDLTGRRLPVRGTLHHDPGGGWTIRDPKTERSRRQVVLAPVAVRALERHRLDQRAERARAGAGPRSTGWSSRTSLLAP
jgi:integrase